MATVKINAGVKTHWIAGIRAVQMLGEFTVSPEPGDDVTLKLMRESARQIEYIRVIEDHYVVRCVPWGQQPNDKGEYHVGRALLLDSSHDQSEVWLVPNEHFGYLMSDTGSTIDRV